MNERFLQYLHDYCVYISGQKILVALSGGADSVALLHLLHTAKVAICAAHCNFNLRGDESDGDEQYVVDLCASLGVTLYQRSFDTTEFATEKGISIEMAARDLRYAWFHDLLKTERLDWIATGHHKDDSIETFFLNLARGTGIKGLVGMKPLRGRLIRPLLAFSRGEIEDYCAVHKLNYRTDSSNLESVYLRNKVRHQILPLFRELNPSFMDTMQSNMKHMEQVSRFFQDSVKELTKEVVVEQDGQLLISLQHVDRFVDKHLVLFEILQPYGFNGSVIQELVECIENQVSGKQFYAPSYRLIKDRFNIILLPHAEKQQDDIFYIEVDQYELKQPVKLNIASGIDAQGYRIDTRAEVAQLDEDLLNYPLTLRKWRHGDQFRPLGMKNFKKLSDFFIDEKFSLKDKEDTWLLFSGDDIIWVVGHRCDDRYKITHRTQHITKIHYQR
ncbi:tRNA lysidine(34) synthetase TilS [Saccharicrinis fermentans]|uniref:tRNA(Ile)-lysidine synthase n=1 Tax=Saccharicrinis fermentans DSM 9555 = JCM 21142 TaxID=869213 RepID=W7YI60_9BACT|nr:tRNA lysidine(34) synthetase TilS [Saccharicrinis fermentans]GAF02239.1 tRNA(Ile)-lysidine synthase [Saccharicrinis fermentans DSM 9555 = JCM 21142]